MLTCSIVSLLYSLFILLFLLTRAAYKGYADTIRLLLFRDANQRRQDKDGMPSWSLVSQFNSITFLSNVMHIISLFLLVFRIWLSLAKLKRGYLILRWAITSDTMWLIFYTVQIPDKIWKNYSMVSKIVSLFAYDKTSSLLTCLFIFA